jgi:hypothetical protein
LRERATHDSEQTLPGEGSLGGLVLSVPTALDQRRSFQKGAVSKIIGRGRQNTDLPVTAHLI